MYKVRITLVTIFLLIGVISLVLLAGRNIGSSQAIASSTAKFPYEKVKKTFLDASGGKVYGYYDDGNGRVTMYHRTKDEKTFEVQFVLLNTGGGEKWLLIEPQGPSQNEFHFVE